MTARGRDEQEALAQVEPVVDSICAVLGDCVYDVTPTSEGSSRRRPGACAGGAAFDRCDGGKRTGGMVAASFVDYPGISAALNEAHVTYANEAKVKYCGVKPETLEAYGAVSEQTAPGNGLRAEGKEWRGYRRGDDRHRRPGRRNEGKARWAGLRRLCG